MTRSVILKFLGIEANRVSHTEKLISAAGGFAGILVTIVVCSYFLELEQAILIIPSLGASAVLLFAAPHSALAQPWSLVGGHLISAFIGVSCALLIPSPALAAAAAVGLAIWAMYYARCIHPPGGATAPGRRYRRFERQHAGLSIPPDACAHQRPRHSAGGDAFQRAISVAQISCLLVKRV